MSYILEALKKSQQERELGHVPTLETPSFLTHEGGGRPNFWVLAALVLAGLAVIIALYSAFRATLPIPEPTGVGTEVPRSATPEGDAPASPPPDLQVAGKPDSDIAHLSPGRTPSPVPATEETGDSRRTVVMEAPAAPSPPVSATESEPPPAARAPVRAGSTEVPGDLVADIEAFKREVREERSTKKRSEKKGKIAPRDLRLPKEVRERLPEFIMSAHIYDEEPAKRFVLINGLKTGEGEESREEIAVEEILPDGAILSFDGNRFFQRR